MSQDQRAKQREPGLRVGSANTHAAGIRGVAVAMHRSLTQMGLASTAKTFGRLNQADGFDCMSCAWPDPDPEHRHGAEFCENGAKAVAEEATRHRVTPDFFARHSIAWLDQQSEHWLGQQGRITHPMVKWPGSTHCEPISWDEAFAVTARHLNDLSCPDEAVFYTSGRASNEAAAFVYQLFVRAYGTIPHPVRDARSFPTPSGYAGFPVSRLDDVHLPAGHLDLQTFRSHDQFNTTIYGLSNRYRGVEGGRRVVFVNPVGILALGFTDGQEVDLVTHWAADDTEPRVRRFRIVSYDTPRGSAAAYYPETNPLVPLDSTATGSNTPTSRSVVVRLEPIPGTGGDEGAAA